MEIKEKKCLCGEGGYVVLSCSGASDLGEISDIIARKLSKNGVRKMSCLAVVGTDIKTSINNFKQKNLLVIDGCPIDCGKRMMKDHQIENYIHLRLTDLGFEKGKTPVSDETVKTIYEQAELLY